MWKRIPHLMPQHEPWQKGYKVNKIEHLILDYTYKPFEQKPKKEDRYKDCLT